MRENFILRLLPLRARNIGTSACHFDYKLGVDLYHNFPILQDISINRYFNQPTQSGTLDFLRARLGLAPARLGHRRWTRLAVKPLRRTSSSGSWFEESTAGPSGFVGTCRGNPWRYPHPLRRLDILRKELAFKGLAPSPYRLGHGLGCLRLCGGERSADHRGGGPR